MKPSTTYINELCAAINGIVRSPQAFYWLMRYKFGVEDERGLTSLNRRRFWRWNYFRTLT